MSLGTGWAIYEAANERRHVLAQDGCYSAYGQGINDSGSIFNRFAVSIAFLHRRSESKLVAGRLDNDVEAASMQFRQLVSGCFLASVADSRDDTLRDALSVLENFVTERDSAQRQRLANCISPDQWVAIASACSHHESATRILSLLLPAGRKDALPAGFLPPPYMRGRRAVPSRRCLGVARERHSAAAPGEGSCRNVEVSAHVAAACAVASALKHSVHVAAVRAAAEQLQPTSATNGLSHSDDGAVAATLILAAAAQATVNLDERTAMLEAPDMCYQLELAAAVQRVADVSCLSVDAPPSQQLTAFTKCGDRLGYIPSGASVPLLRARCAAVDALEALQSRAEQVAAQAHDAQNRLDPLSGWRLPAAAVGSMAARGVARLCAQALRCDAYVLEALGLREEADATAPGAFLVVGGASCPPAAEIASQLLSNRALADSLDARLSRIRLVPLSSDWQAHEQARLATVWSHGGVVAFAACCSGVLAATAAWLKSSAGDPQEHSSVPAKDHCDDQAPNLMTSQRRSDLSTLAQAWSQAGASAAAALSRVHMASVSCSFPSSAAQSLRQQPLPSLASQRAAAVVRDGCLPALHGALLSMTDISDASQAAAGSRHSAVRSSVAHGTADLVCSSVAHMTGAALFVAHADQGDHDHASAAMLRRIMHRPILRSPRLNQVAAGRMDHAGSEHTGTAARAATFPVEPSAGKSRIARHFAGVDGAHKNQAAGSGGSPTEECAENGLLTVSVQLHPLYQLVSEAGSAVGLPTAAPSRIAQLSAPGLVSMLQPLLQAEARNAGSASGADAADARELVVSATHGVAHADVDADESSTLRTGTGGLPAPSSRQSVSETSVGKSSVGKSSDANSDSNSELRMLEDELGLPTRTAAAAGLSAGIAGATAAELRGMASPPAHVKAQLKSEFAALLLPLPDTSDHHDARGPTLAAQNSASVGGASGGSRAPSLRWPPAVVSDVDVGLRLPAETLQVESRPASPGSAAVDGGHESNQTHAVQPVQVTCSAPSILDALLAVSRNGGSASRPAACAALERLLQREQLVVQHSVVETQERPDAAPGASDSELASKVGSAQAELAAEPNVPPRWTASVAAQREVLSLQIQLAQAWMLSTLHGVLADPDLPINARRSAAAEAERWRQRHEAATSNQSKRCMHDAAGAGDRDDFHNTLSAHELPSGHCQPLRLSLFSDSDPHTGTASAGAAVISANDGAIAIACTPEEPERQPLELPPYVREVARDRLRARTRAGLLPPLLHCAYAPSGVSLPLVAHTTKALAYLVGAAAPDDEAQSLLFAHGIDLAALAEAEDGRVHPDAEEIEARTSRLRARITARVLEQGAAAPIAFLAHSALASLESMYGRSAFVHRHGVVDGSGHRDSGSSGSSDNIMMGLGPDCGFYYDAAMLSDLLLDDQVRVQVAVLRQSLRLAANIGHSLAVVESESCADACGAAADVSPRSTAALNVAGLGAKLAPATDRILAPLPGADWFPQQATLPHAGSSVLSQAVVTDSAEWSPGGLRSAAMAEHLTDEAQQTASLVAPQERGAVFASGAAAAVLVRMLAHRDAKTYSFALRCRANLPRSLPAAHEGHSHLSMSTESRCGNETAVAAAAAAAAATAADGDRAAAPLTATGSTATASPRCRCRRLQRRITYGDALLPVLELRRPALPPSMTVSMPVPTSNDACARSGGSAGSLGTGGAGSLSSGLGRGLDIITVHGLQGAALKAWRCPAENPIAAVCAAVAASAATSGSPAAVAAAVLDHAPAASAVSFGDVDTASAGSPMAGAHFGTGLRVSGACVSIPSLWVVKRTSAVASSPRASSSSALPASAAPAVAAGGAALARPPGRRRIALPMAFWPLHWLARDCAAAIATSASAAVGSAHAGGIASHACTRPGCHYHHDAVPVSVSESPLRVIAVSYDADLMSGAGEHGVRTVRPVGRVAMDIRSQLLAAGIGATAAAATSQCNDGAAARAAQQLSDAAEASTSDGIPTQAGMQCTLSDAGQPASRRALLPLAHSFGGIMTKLMLLHNGSDACTVTAATRATGEVSNLSAPAHRDVFSGCRHNGCCCNANGGGCGGYSAAPSRLLDVVCGIAFYATPHRGVSLKAAASLISLSSRLARWAGGGSGGSGGGGSIAVTAPGVSREAGAVVAAAGSAASTGSDESRRPTAAEAAVAAAAAADAVAAASAASRSQAAASRLRASTSPSSALPGHASLASPALALLLDTAALTQLSTAFNAELGRRLTEQNSGALALARANTGIAADADANAASSALSDGAQAVPRDWAIPVVCIAEGRATSIPGVMGLQAPGSASGAASSTPAAAAGTGTGRSSSSWWLRAAKPVAAVATAAARSLAGGAAAAAASVSRAVLQVTIVPAGNADAGAPGGHAIVVTSADHVQVCKPESPAVEMLLPVPVKLDSSNGTASTMTAAAGSEGLEREGGVSVASVSSPRSGDGAPTRSRNLSFDEVMAAAEDPRYGAALWLASRGLDVDLRASATPDNVTAAES